MKHLFTSLLACAVTISALAASPRTGATSPLREKSRVTAKLENAPKATVGATKAFADAAVKAPKAADKRLAKKTAPDALKRAGLRVRKAADDAETLLDETFACLTTGTPEAPAEIVLDDEYNIPVGIIGEENYGFGGQLLFSAGGQLYIPGWYEDSYGYMWTPNVKGGGYYTISMDVCLTGVLEEDDLVVEFYDGINFEGIDQTWETISNGWNSISLEIDGTTAEANVEEVYFIIYPYEGDVLVKNFKVEATFPAIKAPVVLPYSDLTATSFTANWEAVEGATEYLLSVYEFDFDKYDIAEALFEDRSVDATSYVVEGITPGVGYVYWVTASDGTNVSSPSEYATMWNLLPPTGLKAAFNSDKDAIDVSWDETPGANIYQVLLYSNYIAPEDEDLVLADADFSSIKSDGTPADPEISEDLQIEVEQMPGWVCTFPAYVDGALGFQDDEIYALFGLYSNLQSPEYDLSLTSGDIDIVASVASGVGSALEIYLGVADEIGNYKVVDKFFSDPLTADFAEVKATLKGADAKSALIFYPGLVASDEDGETMLPNVFFKSLKVSVPLKAGDVFSTMVAEELPETNECVFDFAAEENHSYDVTVTAFNVDEDLYINLWSETSQKVRVYNDAALESIAADKTAEGPVVYFDLSGRRIAEPTATGLYIRRQGNDASKVLVK